MLLISISFSFVASQETNNTLDNSTKNKKPELNFTFEIDPYENVDFGDIIWLDDTNATSEINKHDIIYVLFYTVWCEPCFVFMTVYIEAAKMAKERNLNIPFTKIDGRVNVNTSEQFELQQFPSLFLIYKGKRYFYEGKIHNPESVLKFIDRKKNNDIINLNSLAEINEYKNSSFLTLLSTIKDKENKIYKSFEEFSKVKMNIDFVVCTSDECIKEYDENMVLFKEFDEKINLFTKEMGPINNATSDSLKEFLAIYSVEAGGILTARDLNMMLENDRNMIMYFRDSNNANQTKYDKLIKEIGLELRQKKIYSVSSDIQEDPIQSEIANAFMVLPVDLPVFLLHDRNINTRYGDLAHLYVLRNMKEEQFNKDYLLKYIDDIFAGKVKFTLYSQPPLDNYDNKGVKIVIGRTFDSDVIDNKNNVLLALTNGAIVDKGTNRVIEVMQNLSRKYNEQEDKILFACTDAQKNQPRDVVIAGKRPPIVLLYTNALEEKKKIELKSNFTSITEEEVENFLMENLGWKQKKEYKEDTINTNEKKEETKEEKIEEPKEKENKDKDKKENKDKDNEDNKMNSDL